MQVTEDLKSRNWRNFTADYKFEEYPKWVNLADGTPILVHNADEEIAAIGEPDPEAYRNDLMQEREQLMARLAEIDAELGNNASDEMDELQQLIEEAKSLGLNANRRFSPDSIRAMIAEAKGTGA
jgi:flagellar biosynthesis/type III secretory pathway protein FliH